MSVNTKINGQLVKSASLAKAIVPLGLGDIYSTEERQIGVWEDGRPLYQRTYIWDNTSGISGNTATIPIDNTIRVIDYIAHVYNSTNDRTYFIPHARDKGSSFMVMDGYLYLVTNDSWGTAYSPFFITIKYTKTTDVAGSGIWTPSGALAKHYSTEEQIIGTWLGKPLYNRVLPEITFNGNGYNYEHNIGIESYINIGGSCTVNGASNPVPFPFYQSRWNGYCGIRSADDSSIYFDSNWSGTNKVRAYIEYTKISD